MQLTPDERRIRDALEQIQTPMYDILSAVQEQRGCRGRGAPRLSPHRLLAAMLAALLLTMTAAAAVLQFSGGWRVLFGSGVSVPPEITLPVQRSQSVGGCTVTLEDAIVSSSSVAVIFSVRREEGQALSQPVDFGEALLSIDGREAQTPRMTQSVFDPENPAVQYCYQEYACATAGGEVGLSFTIGPLLCMEQSGPVAAEVDLAALYQAQPLQFAAESGLEERAPAYLAQDFSQVSLPLAERAPAVRLAGLALDGDGLCLALTCTEGGVTADVSLLDTRTGEILQPAESSSFASGGSRLSLHETRFRGLDASDLAWLQPQLGYTFPLQLTAQPVAFSFRTRAVDAWAREVALQLEDGVTVERVTVSPTSVEIEGTHPEPSRQEQPAVTLLRKDGTEIAATATATTLYSDGSGGAAAFSVLYEYQAPDLSRRFLSLDEIEAIRIDGLAIPIEE